MIHALLNGTLGSDPTERTTSKGDRYVTANLRVSAGHENIFIGMAAFDAAAADRLAALAKGARIAAAGELQLNVWRDRQDVEHRDWRLLVSEVMSVAQARGKRRATQGAAEADSEA